MRSISVYYKGDLAGELVEHGRSDFSFQYNSEFLQHPRREPISLTLPLRPEAYHGHSVFPFFANMLAEGVNLELQCQLHRVDVQDVMGLLIATAGGDAIGAVTLVPNS